MRQVFSGCLLCCAVLVLAVREPSFAGVNTWTTHGPGGGLVLRIEVDPLSPATLYAATEVGVFKSTNGGGAWTAMNTGLPSLSIRCLAVDPQTPTTLYAGAGGGVSKSVDGGASWSSASTGLPVITHLNTMRVVGINHRFDVIPRYQTFGLAPRSPMRAR
jgi:photosystem II stability/assembly factor-like uncharacterized protein